MARRSEERKAELQRKYGNDAFTPIHPKYIEQARQLSARYILFANKDNKHGVCEKCMKDVEFTKTKHKEKITCPNCGTELTTMHTWRRKCDWNVDWYVIGEVIDEDTFVLRYIEVEQKEDFTKNIGEKAREVYDFKHGWHYQFSYLPVGGWSVDNRCYFTEFNMFNRRKEFCIAADSLNNIEEELNKLSALKYFDKAREYFRTYWYPSNAVKKLMNASLYEKLEKVGLSDIVKGDFHDWSTVCTIRYKRTETSLVKMLGINKAQYKLFLASGNKKTLDFIRSHKTMPIEELNFIITNKAIDLYNRIYNKSSWEAEIAPDDEKGKKKTLKYLVKNEINSGEYAHYLSLLNKLEYEIDDNYRYTKDFRKADDRVTQEWEARLDEERLKKMSKQSRLIKKISDGLRKMPDLQEFLNGSNGLLVYVPESAKELLEQGRALHNCIGTYVDRIAEGKTLVFFVRRLEAPNDPFVAFEYVNGEVVQCRADHNKNVTDDKIISFVDAFAERLRKNKVLYKVA